jgi:precorrin-6A synthase
MLKLSLIGIGSGDPDHLTSGAIRAINAAGFILIPDKGEGKAGLADARRAILKLVLTNTATKVVDFDLPKRDEANPDYRDRVDDWHDAIAAIWAREIAKHLGLKGHVALLVWGDPSLYDSTLRIADRLNPKPEIDVIPGITAIQALCAAHRIPLNEIAEPVVITTGRQLRDHGWPTGATTLVVMLDSGGAFKTIDANGVEIWWGAYLGLPEQLLVHGQLKDVGLSIVAIRADARARHGWIMDTYILRRSSK